MAELSWLPAAIQDIERLHSFLYVSNPQAAADAIRLIKHTAMILEDNPKIGKPMPDETGRRELIAAYGAGAYILRYKLAGMTPVVIRVWHSRENRG